MPFLPYIPFANVMECILKGVMAEQQVIITNAFQKPSALDFTDLEAMAGVMDQWWNDYLQPKLVNTLTMTTIKITDLTTESAATLEVAVTGTQAGAISTVSVPNNVALVISMVTESRGRSYRGRNYLPGVPAARLLTTTSFDSTIRTDMVDAYNQLDLLAAAAGFTHVVLSRQNGGVRRTTGVSTPVAEFIARAPVGTQRRRVVGVGA